MGSLNKVMLIGNLGGDPELNEFNGGSVANFTMATTERWTDKHTGNREEKTEWHRVQAWGPLAVVAANCLSKGRQCYVEGSLTTRSWEDQQSGQKRYKTEVKASKIEFLDKKEEERQGSGYQPPQPKE